MSNKSTSRSTTEYDESKLPAYTPMQWTLKEIKDAIPAHLFIRSTTTSLLYFVRDICLAAAIWSAATYIDPYFGSSKTRQLLTPLGAEILRWAAWCVYWWFQGLVFTGIWVIGHECGHGAFSDYRIVNDTIGFITHSSLWTPYFSWKISHHRHHSNHASMERDEVYVPKTREDLGIPDADNDKIDWDEIFGDTPIYTLYMLVRQQLLAFPAYLLFNVSGQKNYPQGTNHFNPDSILFTKSQRNVVIMSNIGIALVAATVSFAVSRFGGANVVKFYFIPWLEVTHWYSTLPHYRGEEWNFQRGAAATVDRPFLGWQGRFFLHDVAHFHVIHHFFPKMPWYNGAEATDYLKAFIGEHYAYSDKPVFQALWESYNDCQFVEDKGDVLFYRNKKGQAVRRPADEYTIKKTE